MSNLVRWDPFREMMALRKGMDRLFDEMLESPQWPTEGMGEHRLALDVTEKEDRFVVKASLPGINPDDLEINLTDNILTIKGEVRQEEEKEGEKYHLRERRYGRFVRSLTLPVSVNDRQCEATYENGVLTLELPKSEEAKPKRISIKPGKSIEG
jgi:HSP20 family protein